MNLAFKVDLERIICSLEVGDEGLNLNILPVLRMFSNNKSLQLWDTASN